jgi:hypothetical protein
VTARPVDIAAAAAVNAARDIATEGVEMLLALEDLRGARAQAGPLERADGERLALRARAVSEALYPLAEARDVEALARILEIVATDDLELPR